MKLRISTRPGIGPDGFLCAVDEHGAQYTGLPAPFESVLSAVENWPGLLAYLRAATPQSAGLAGAAPHTHEPDAPVLRRTYQALYASAYDNRAVRVAQCDDAPSAPAVTRLLMYQGASDYFLGNGEALQLAGEQLELDLEPEIGIIVDRVPMGISAANAHRHICLVTCCNDFTYRGLIRAEHAAGFGFIQGKPLTSMAPIALTPDALGQAWHDGRLLARVQVEINGRPFCLFGTENMEFGFHELIAHAAATRPLAAGTFISSGTISAAGSGQAACIVEQRALDAAAGRRATPFLAAGDVVRVQIVDDMGRALFGTLENRIVGA